MSKKPTVYVLKRQALAGPFGGRWGPRRKCTYILQVNAHTYVGENKFVESALLQVTHNSRSRMSPVRVVVVLLLSGLTEAGTVL